MLCFLGWGIGIRGQNPRKMSSWTCPGALNEHFGHFWSFLMIFRVTARFLAVKLASSIYFGVKVLNTYSSCIIFGKGGAQWLYMEHNRPRLSIFYQKMTQEWLFKNISLCISYTSNFLMISTYTI